MIGFRTPAPTKGQLDVPTGSHHSNQDTKAAPTLRQTATHLKRRLHLQHFAQNLSQKIINKQIQLSHHDFTEFLAQSRMSCGEEFLQQRVPKDEAPVSLMSKTSPGPRPHVMVSV